MKWGYLLAIATCLALVCVAKPTGAGELGTESRLGKRIEPFELRDFRGKSYSLDELLKDRRALVIAFLGTECPLALQYAPRLEQLSERFAPQGVAFVGINANQQDSITELAEYAKIHNLKFPLLKDVGNVVADQLAAQRTPEVFVIDAERTVRYRGRIDDQYVVGRQRKKATRDDLAMALDELLAGSAISQPITDVQGCRIGRVQPARASGDVTYTKHIAPLLNKRCVECHREGEIAPFALTSYAEVAGWAAMMLEVIDANRMPPWHANPDHGKFGNDRRLSDDEKELLTRWVAAGTPEGDLKDLPTPPQFAEGWRLPRIDQVVKMADHPAEIPAEGTVDYKYFTVDPGFTEDKWIQAAECRPGNRGVVHHIILLTRPPGGFEGRETIATGYLTATAPGAAPLLLKDGQAKLVKAGSKFVFQMHYTPNGSPQQDLSSVGLMFADPATVTQQVKTEVVESHTFLIPPKANNFKVEAWQIFRQDTQLLSLFPHMHLRGKSFRYEVTYPDGRKEILLDVPQYDFAWQQTYDLAEPKLIPKGTKMRVTAHYDNSADNIANPNPSALVHWGEQTWDEMMMGFMDTILPQATAQSDAKTDTAAKPAGEASRK